MGKMGSEEQLISQKQKVEKPRLKRIVILGMGRSGTSFLTGCLAKCGVYVDEVSDKLEHTRSRVINDTILREQYRARQGRPDGKLPADEIQLLEHWHDKERPFIAYMEARAEKS